MDSRSIIKVIVLVISHRNYSIGPPKMENTSLQRHDIYHDHSFQCVIWFGWQISRKWYFWQIITYLEINLQVGDLRRHKRAKCQKILEIFGFFLARYFPNTLKHSYVLQILSRCLQFKNSPRYRIDVQIGAKYFVAVEIQF